MFSLSFWNKSELSVIKDCCFRIFGRGFFVDGSVRLILVMTMVIDYGNEPWL